MSSIASIDELLRYEEEPPRRQRAPGGFARWAVRAALAAAALTALIAVALRVAGVAPPYVLVFAGLYALLALRRVVARGAPPPPRTRHARTPGEEDGHYVWGAHDALRSAPRPWEGRLVWTWGDTHAFAQATQPALREIVDERLRLRFGFTTRSDPARARTILDDALWTFMTTPASRAPGPAELADLVGRIERLGEGGTESHAARGRDPRTRPHTNVRSARGGP